MEKYSQYRNTTHLYNNEDNLNIGEYSHTDILSLSAFEKAKKEITSWSRYNPTDLISLDNLAKNTNVSKIYYKDENHRFGLKSFKALGGAYAVANLLIEQLKLKGIDANSTDLLNKKYENITKNITVSCATDGNHGKSVAWGALMFGCKCEIFIHSHVSANREKEIAKLGANVTRVNGNYDDSVRIAANTAQNNGFFTVSDTSYKGYTKVPKDVMQGYTIMVDEAINQIKEKPTHVFLQGGVGGMAAAVVSFFHETYGKNSPKFIIVEPNNADCLLQSAKNGKPTVVHGDLETIMAGLSCGEVSLIAWEILKNTVSSFISIDDNSIGQTMKLLANNNNPIIAGESAVAGLAGYLITQSDEIMREQLHINKNSKILFFGTEGDTDELMYEQLVGKNSKEVLKNGVTV
jgi:diaminopropionate ammonia-lyase